jgi:hypothetical protein
MKKTLPKILLGVVLACALFLVFLYANNDIGKTANSLSRYPPITKDFG